MEQKQEVIPQEYLEGIRDGYAARMKQAKTGYWNLSLKSGGYYRKGYMVGREIAANELGFLQ